MWEKRQHTGSAEKTGRPHPETTAPMGHSLEMGLTATECEPGRKWRSGKRDFMGKRVSSTLRYKILSK